VGSLLGLFDTWCVCIDLVDDVVGFGGGLLKREPADPNVIFVFWFVGFLTGFMMTVGTGLAGHIFGGGMGLLFSYAVFRSYYDSFEEDEEVG